MVSAATELVEGKIAMEQLKARKDVLAKEAGKVVKTAAQSAAKAAEKRKAKTEPAVAATEAKPDKPTERPAKRSRVASEKAKAKPNNQQNRDFLRTGLCPPSGRDPVPGDPRDAGDPGDRGRVLAGHVEDHDGGAVVNLSVR